MLHARWLRRRRRVASLHRERSACADKLRIIADRYQLEECPMLATARVSIALTRPRLQARPVAIRRFLA